MIRLLSLIAALCAALSVRAENDDELLPRDVGFVGRLCETGLVISVFDSHDFILATTDGLRRRYTAREDPGIAVGDIIVTDSDIKLSDKGDINLGTRAVRRIGRGNPPPPISVALSDISTQDLIYRKITVEGTLVLAREDEIDPLYFQLIVKDGQALLNVSTDLQMARRKGLAGLLGARLRMTGLLEPPIGARKTLAPSLSIGGDADIEIVQPVPKDIFAVPELDFSSPFMPKRISQLGSQRFAGIVMATWDGNQMMIAGKGYHCIKATLARETELPTAGAPVEVVGYPEADSYGINLSFARCRPLDGPPPRETALTPIPTTLRNLLIDRQGRRRIHGYSHGRLLRISGKVLDIQPSLHLFSLHADGVTLTVDCSSSPSALTDLEANSTVEAIVLSVAESDTWRENNVRPQTRGIRLVLRSANDLRVIARPPFWTPVRLALVIAALLVALVLVVVLNRLVNRLATRRKVAERTRLAVELHDSLSQTLAGVTCQIAAGRDAVADDPQTATSLLEAAERMLESSRTELKNCLFDLRNNTVDDPDFVHAITRTLSIFRDESSLAIRFPVDRSLLSDTAAHTVLCIIRELVANAIRHGKAAHVRVVGSVENDTLLFSVSDDGSGFDPADRPGPREGHFGLTGIQERLSSSGGSMKIESSRGKTRVSITLPL